MNKEQQELLDEAYQNYVNKTKFPGGDTVPKIEFMYPDSTILTQEKFINKCKTDPEFSEKWGLKIEEQELGLEERYHIWFTNNYETGMERYFDPNNIPKFDDPYYEPTPTKLITITYNNKTIESYDTKNNTIFRN